MLWWAACERRRSRISLGNRNARRSITWSAITSRPSRSARPPVGQDRLQPMPDGTVALELRRRWTDGTTHLIFDPVELLERLAALVPRPRINLVLYHGALAPRAAWRRAIAPVAEERTGEAAEPVSACDHQVGGDPPRNRTWAELMQRSFGFDVLACPNCPGRLRLGALIRAPDVVGRILRHLGLPEAVPTMRPARDGPVPLDGAAGATSDF